jgi:hypothetical protein
MIYIVMRLIIENPYCDRTERLKHPPFISGYRFKDI